MAHLVKSTTLGGVGTMAALLQAIRPRQWIKNTFVFTALVFSEERLWTHPDRVLIVMLAFVAFCLAASGIYLINDLVDIEKDRAHPRKRHRPIAAGKISPWLAGVTVALLLLTACVLGYLIDPIGGFLVTLIAYILIQGLLYSYVLKHIVIFDILTIAAGFVLRAVAGAVVLHITITPWLLVCMGLLATFLGIGKRRHELILLQDGAGEHRRILNEYSVPMLDQMMSIISASVIMAYGMITFSAPALPQEPYPVMMITIPFVIYGIFRYYYLIYQRDGGGSPEELVLTDLPMALNIVCWGIISLALLFFFPTG